jgi:ureidoacrylate peracid hydrolase
MIDKNDPYIGWRKPLAEPTLTAGASALLVIDMQYADADMDHGIMAKRRAMGQTVGLDYYAHQLARIIPNIQRLQGEFRTSGREVIFARIQSATASGRDRGGAHKDLEIFCPPGSKDAEILAQLAPQEDELVFSKTTGSVFNGTNIDFVLGNMGIETLVMVGVMTSGCVESAARDAKDLGYGVIVAEDACASWSEALHRNSLRCMGEVFAKIKTVDEILAALAATDGATS